MLKLTPRFAGQVPSDLPESLKPLAHDAPTLARLYAGRGITAIDDMDTKLANLLPADGLLGLDAAATILDEAIDQGKRILIVGDFDCDGATSTALMIRVLREMGADAEFIVPDRFKYGYGLTPEIVDLGIETYHPDVIVTVDNGISSHDGVARAKDAGITVVITDHHLTTKSTPPADAVVNPNQLGCGFDSKSLVGVGVAFYLLGRLAKMRRSAGKSSAAVSQHLDLVALGTIADVGVLDRNNRTLVYHGIQAIRQGRCCLGILALLEQAGRDYKKLTAQDFGFVLGPRINAAGRMDNMRIGIECLLTDDLGEAQRLAYELDGLNRERRTVEGKMREQADDILAQLQAFADSKPSQDNDDSLDNSTNTNIEASANTKDDEDNNANDNEALIDIGSEAKPKVTPLAEGARSIILYQDDWHQGVIGIVAGRLKESHYRPAIVFAPANTDNTGDNDAIKGSARSIPGIHIRDAIELVAERHPELITHFGGHAMAAGLTLKRANFEHFVEAFEA
ncbi:MAG: DHH family phosphoesterase, partial [Psychrobacter sp.]|nr:DHH family phosphoesterase [Psychrobacter sp.]